VPAGVPTRSAHSVRIADEKPGKPRLTARWRGRKSPPAETLSHDADLSARRRQGGEGKGKSGIPLSWDRGT